MEGPMEPQGFNAIIARMYQRPSLFEGKACNRARLLGDLANRRLPRDEIRQIGQGFYLGKVYGHENPLMHFSLKFSTPDASPESSLRETRPSVEW